MYFKIIIIIILLIFTLLLSNNYESFIWRNSEYTRMTKNMIYDIRGSPFKNNLTFSSFIKKLFPYHFDIKTKEIVDKRAYF